MVTARSRGHVGVIGAPSGGIRAGTIQISLPVAQMGELMQKCTTGGYD
jgi:hypothetical protein